MKIFALEDEHPHATAEGFQQYTKDEARKVWALVQAGGGSRIILLLDGSGAVLVLECQTVEEAREALSTLPFIQNKLITFDLIPLKAYPGVQRLFA